MLLAISEGGVAISLGGPVHAGWGDAGGGGVAIGQGSSVPWLAPSDATERALYLKWRMVRLGLVPECPVTRREWPRTALASLNLQAK